MPDKPNLANLSVRRYLTIYSNPFLKVVGKSLTPTTPGGPSSASIAAEPRSEVLPGAELSLAGGGGQSPTATVSLGGKLLKFQSLLKKTPGGDTVTNTVSGNIGPVQLSAQRNRSKQGDVDTRTDTFRASGSVPLGPGTLSGNVNRQFVEDQDPVTNYQAGWEGRVGPGTLHAEGNLRHVRNKGIEPSVGGSYIIPNRFGWVGATGSYREGAGEAMLRGKLNF